MREFNVVVGENGRMIIPSLFRKTLNLKAGDEVVVKLSADNDIVIHSPKQSLKKLQELFKNSGNGESLVDALFEMRRKEEI
jgi:AbrB family looped-hinge helix DNA binding protein